VSSTVVFEVPDRDARDLSALAERFYSAHRAAVGVPMMTLTGQEYVLVEIERLEVAAR
jgi:hypothetical protein